MILIFVALIFQQDSKVSILTLVMLVKLAFVMQRLKNYLKKFSSSSTKMGEGTIQLDFMGGHSCYERGHRAHGGPPVSPLRKTLDGHG